MTVRPVRVAAYGYFGMGNIGNEASLAAFVDYMREQHPSATLSCYVAGPDQVEREHGVPATQLMSYRADPSRGGPLVLAAKILSRLRDVPRTFAMMGDVDVLVVPGTGVLETKLVATPWGLPYWLFLATLTCRLRRRRVVLLNVGAEPPVHPVTRWLYRWTVRLANHCTYRDQASRDAVRSMGVRGRLGGVYPDLAFRLPTPEADPERSGHLVLGVMAYQGSPDDPARGPDMVRTYVTQMTDLVTRLVDGGRTVTLVIGDLGDHDLATDILEAVHMRRPGLGPTRVSVSDATTVQEIMREMGEAEVVLASRFHNVICALKMARPTVSLGYAEKNVHVLSEFGLGRFSQPMEAFDVDRLLEQVDDVRRVHPSVEGLMKETLRRYEDTIDEELAEIFGEVLGPRPGRLAQVSAALRRRFAKR
jgi:polysaccharide pyruvyl transferase WcaK-like protein